MTREASIAWAAGIFEGEGTVLAPRDKPRKDGTAKRRLRVEIIMCDEDILLRVRDALGMGYVKGPIGPYGTSVKPRYWWRVVGDANTDRFIALVWPWLGTRRRAQIEEQQRLVAESR